MFNLFKKEIEFFPTTLEIDKVAPIVPASKFLPKWWTDIDPNKHVNLVNNVPVIRGNIKKCPGVSDFLTKGFILPAWTDFYFCYENGKMKKISSLQSHGIIHQPDTSFIDFLPDNIKFKKPISYKLLTPWLIKTPPGYSSLILNPTFHFNDNFDTMPGILDTDIFHTLSIEILVKESKTFTIPFNTPLCIIVPFKRNKFKYKINLNKAVMEKLSSLSNLISFAKFSSSAMYNYVRRSKCPFNNK